MTAPMMPGELTTCSTATGRFTPAFPAMAPGKAAELLGVNTKTLQRWAATGKLRAIRTPGGHRRYHSGDVGALVAERRGGA